MITVKDIYEYINSIAPFDSQCEWDNSGILTGDRNCEVNKIAVCLDITSESVETAYKMGAQLIISHHPVIFNGLKSIESGSPIESLVRKKIATISIHTPFDKANDGVNDVLARIIGLKNISSIADEGEAVMLRKGNVEEISPDDLAAKLKRVLGGGIKYNIGGRTIKKVAVCGGSGAEFTELAYSAGCDAFVTADVKHHQYLLAQSKGITIYDAGHYETENIAMASLAEKLQKKYKSVEIVFLDNCSIKTI